MCKEEKKEVKESVPRKRAGAARPGAQKPPAKPSAPTETNIKDKSAMPNLDQFNFMKW